MCVCVCVVDAGGGMLGEDLCVTLQFPQTFNFDDLRLLFLIFACEYSDSSRLTHEENVAIIDELVRDILGREQFL